MTEKAIIFFKTQMEKQVNKEINKITNWNRESISEIEDNLKNLLELLRNIRYLKKILSK